ncbi:MAG: toxic anion resistance protein [Coprococcus sp.]
MSEIKLGEAPTLTFEPFKEEPLMPAETEKAETPAAIPEYDDSMLNEDEKKMVRDFAAQIDIANSAQVLQYGAGAQQKVAAFSEKALENVRTKDLGEVGDMISGVVTELKSFDVEEEEKGFLGLFKKNVNKLTAMKAKYQKAEANVNQIVEALEQHQITLMKDVATLDQLYELNKTYYKELTMYILAGKQKLHEVETVQIPALAAKAQASGLPEDAQAVSDLTALANRFEKKLHDLELTRVIAIQMAPQIRLVQNNDTMMSDKIQSTIVNTIPLWKSQMVIALGIAHSEQAAKVQREVSDLTNEMLKKNADRLKTASINVAKESERGIVDIETLQTTNQQLITTLDEVLKIQTEGREKRRAAEVELQKIEGDLKAKLLGMRASVQ